MTWDAVNDICYDVSSSLLSHISQQIKSRRDSLLHNGPRQIVLLFSVYRKREWNSQRYSSSYREYEQLINEFVNRKKTNHSHCNRYKDNEWRHLGGGRRMTGNTIHVGNREDSSLFRDTWYYQVLHGADMLLPIADTSWPHLWSPTACMPRCQQNSRGRKSVYPQSTTIRCKITLSLTVKTRCFHQHILNYYLLFIYYWI